jgi:hypothetical protein
MTLLVDELGNMGGTNFFKHNEGEKKSSDDLKGTVAFFDCNSFIWHFAVGSLNSSCHPYLSSNMDLDEMDIDEESISNVSMVMAAIATVTMVIGLLKRDVFPVFVCDGQSSQIGMKKVEYRKNKCKIAIEALQENNDSEQKTRLFKKAVSFRSKQFKLVKKILEAMGFTLISSIEEADSQCAIMASRKTYNGLKISGAVSEDSDPLLFGCPTLIKDFYNKTHTVSKVNLDDILKKLELKINTVLNEHNKPSVRITRETLIDLQIIEGTDYNSPIIGLTHDELFRLFVLNDLNMEKFINDVQNLENVVIPEDFVNEWRTVRENYLNPKGVKLYDDEILFHKSNPRDLYNILCDQYNFKEEVIFDLIEKLKSHYVLYNNLVNQIPQNRDFSNFGSSRVRYYRQKQENINKKSTKDERGRVTHY